MSDMIHASPRDLEPAEPADLSLPRWAFVALEVQLRKLRGGEPAAFVPAPDPDIEARRRARLLAEIVPQDV